MCDCEGMFYWGIQCEDFFYCVICYEYKVLGMVQDVYCKVDFDGIGLLEVFEVLCNMIVFDVVKIVIYYDKEGEYFVIWEVLCFDSYYF